MSSRYEILPFGRGEEEAAELTEPARITITCSPRHSIDRTVEVAVRLRALGHQPVVHLAARMLADREHLDAVLDRLATACVDDIFLIGGDATEPHGPYSSALELLPIIHHHPHRPAAIGIGAYPEGHPLIDPDTLRDALHRKSELADYVVTQLCFDADTLLDWLAEARAAGLQRPIYVGLPGAVDRRRLLEVSLRVGVGASVSFLRKQRGLRRLFSRPTHATTELYDAVAPRIGDPRFGIAGLHWYTFDRLLDTVAWEREHAEAAAPADRSRRLSAS